MKKKGKKKKTISGRKQSVSEKKLSYLRQHVESSVIAAFASHKSLKPQWKVKKPTGPIANKPMPHGSKWKTYWGKFVTFKKDGKIYYVLFQYSFLRGVYDISITTSYTDDRDIIILDFYSNLVQRIINGLDTLYFNLFPRLYEKRHLKKFPTKQ